MFYRSQQSRHLSVTSVICILVNHAQILNYFCGAQSQSQAGSQLCHTSQQQIHLLTIIISMEEKKMLCPLLDGRSRCKVSYGSMRDSSFSQRGLFSSGDRVRLFLSFVFAGRRVQVQAGQLGLQRRRRQTTHTMRTLTLDP